MRILILEKGNKAYIMPTENTKKTEKLVRQFITHYAVHRNYDTRLLYTVFENAPAMKWFVDRLNFAELTHCTTESGFKYVKIVGKNFNIVMRESDYEKDVVFMSTESVFKKMMERGEL